MKRLLAVVLATAAAAAVAAAITIPAGADAGADADATFVACLRSHGADIPAGTRGIAIKQWLIAHEPGGAIEDALNACQAKDGPRGPGAQELAACMRGQGLDVPSALDELKPWVFEHADDANAKKAFAACHFDVQPSVKAVAGPQDEKKFADCLRTNGADVPAGLHGAELKQWVGDHASADALKACAGGISAKPGCGEAGEPGPDTKPAPAPSRDPSITIER
jgi:hypothetical protein